jgi:hypothetical protein
MRSMIRPTISLAGALLALAVSPWFWWLVRVAAILIGAALLVALTRATRVALRPQRVRYDHSWWTNLFGGTSTPHPGPAERTPDRPEATDPSGDSNECHG